MREVTKKAPPILVPSKVDDTMHAHPSGTSAIDREKYERHYEAGWNLPAWAFSPEYDEARAYYGDKAYQPPRDERDDLYSGKLETKRTTIDDLRQTIADWAMLPQPGNSDHLGYRVYHGKPPNGEGQWATQKTLNSIFDVAEALGDASLFQIGDLSLENSALFHTGRGHRDGTAFDVRPVRRDRKQQPVQWNWTESYDREATQRLVDVLLAAGAKKILFNDPKIEGVTPWEGHDNHLHVAF